MKLLITGCARSGTTILTHMMRYFYSTKVAFEDEAHPMEYMNYNHSDHILVIKKPYLESSSLGYFTLQSLLYHGWKVIWLLRDGRDVITSINHPVSQTRWVEANTEYMRHYQSKEILLIRYEQLVSSPYAEMDRIKDFIGQPYQDDFLDFHKLMTDTPMNKGIIPAPINQDTIGRFKNFPHQEYNDNFAQLLNIFGYE